MGEVKKKYEADGKVFRNNDFVQYDALLKQRQGSNRPGGSSQAAD